MPELRVLITSVFLHPGDEVDRRLRDAGIEPVYVPWTGRQSEEALIDLLSGIDGAIVAGNPFTQRVLNAVDRLKVISRTGVGYDAIDVEAATARGIVVCNTPGVNRHAVAEYAFGLMIHCARHMTANLAEVRKGGWTRHEGRDLAGSTLGLVGLGTIGREVAQRARAFEMRILAYDPIQDVQFAEEHGVEFAPLERLLRESDYVSLHLLLSEKTRHIIDAERLAMMKPSAYLINTARGGIVDEEALYEALKRGQLAGAALDVLQKEPPDLTNPLLTLDNVYLSPHAGGVTSDARALSGTTAAENVIRALRGERPLHILNPRVLD